MPPKIRILKTEASITSKPPSHPGESAAEHRAFLKRSLDRSDKELAALQTLHRTLAKLRATIVNKYGESRLLDIGQGFIFIDPQNGNLVIDSKADMDKHIPNLANEELSDSMDNDNDDDDPNSEFAKLAKDFLLRMKLRQKIMNRLARRTMRLSHIMDGRIGKINPPAVPKYGEVRLLSTTQEYSQGLQEFKTQFTEMEQVHERIQERILATQKDANVHIDQKDGTDEYGIDPLLFNEEHQKDKQQIIKYDEEYDLTKTIHLPPTSDKIKSAISDDDILALDKQPEDFDYDKEEYKDNIGATIWNMNNNEKATEWKRWQVEFLSKIPDQPTFEDLGMKHRVFDLEERKKLKQGHGASEVDKAATGEDGTIKMENPAVAEENKADVEMMDVDPNPDVKKEKLETVDGSIKKDSEGVTSSSPPDNKDDDKVADDEHDEKEETKCEKPETIMDKYMKKKSFSLDPIPSFHDQDYRRILMIHSDLISNSLQESSRKIIADATADYNEAFRMSTEYQNSKLALETEQEQALANYQVKTQLFERTRLMAYQEWQQNKKQFANQQLQRKRVEYQSQGKSFMNEHSLALRMDDKGIVHRALSGAVDRVVIRNAPMEQARGSRYTSSCANSSHDPILSQVATSLAHCVDVVVKRVDSRWVSTSILDDMKGEEYPAFKYDESSSAETIPLNEKGETLEQINARVTAQLAKVAKHLNTCEQARAQKWSKLMKAKAEVGGSTNNGQKQRARINRPVMTKGIGQRKNEYPVTSSFTPQNRNVTSTMKAGMHYNPMGGQQRPGGMIHDNNGSGLDSKYSLEAVRARMSSDGSVRPINTPKMTKDGLYMRPAGRQRKGMDWDAVNGKWMPEGSLR
jgi:hypothetical protein